MVPDKYFHQYIVNRIDEHNDRTRRKTEIQFMATAKSKYDDLVEAGTWLQKDDTEKQLVALTAQLKQIEIKHKNLQKKWKDNQKKKKKDDKSKGSNKSDNKKWKWKSVAPKNNESKTKVFEGKTYFWCPHHKKWTLHKPDECRLKDRQDHNQEEGTSTQAETYAAVLDDGAFTDI